MVIKKQITGLLEKEMDRKSFLKYSGSLLVAAIGVGGVLRIMRTSLDVHEQRVTFTKQTTGYGSSEYGS